MWSKSHSSKAPAFGGTQQGSHSWKTYAQFFFFSGIFMKQWKECQRYLERRKKYIRISFFFCFRFSLNCSQHWGYPHTHPLRPPPHLFSASPPATHFNLINDPSPTTGLYFYRLLFNVDLLRPVSLQSFSWSDHSLMLMFNSSIASAMWNSLFNALLWHMYERMVEDGGVMRNTRNGTFAMEMLFIYSFFHIERCWLEFVQLKILLI